MSHHFNRVTLPPKLMIAITAPSGAGKSTLVKKLIQQRSDLSFSVSCTTREKRSGEVDGKDYYFISTESFKSRVANGEFAEYEEVYPGKFYGTLKSEIERIWQERKVVVFDIDVKGAANLKKQYGNDCLIIFIQPPSAESLKERLLNRSSEDRNSLKVRLKKAEEELAFAKQSDKIILNRDFDTAFMRLKNAITGFLKPQTTFIH